MNNESVFKALSDHNRRQIISLLRKQTTMTAGEIAERFPISKPTISEHLKILLNANLVYSKRRGQFVEYSLNTSIFQEIIAFFLALATDKTKSMKSKQGGNNEANKTI